MNELWDVVLADISLPVFGVGENSSMSSDFARRVRLAPLFDRFADRLSGGVSHRIRRLVAGDSVTVLFKLDIECGMFQMSVADAVQ